MLFDESDVIFSYSTEQAIEDGVLHHLYPQRWPWLLITNSVYCGAETESDKGNRTLEQVIVPLLQDCIMEVQRRIAVARKRGEEPSTPIILEHTAIGTIWIMPNDKGGITVMLPSDY